MRRILVVTDFSVEADVALELAIGLARSESASLEILHVRGPVSRLLAPAGQSREAQDSLASADLVDRRNRALDAGVRCLTMALRGVVHAAVLRYAGRTDTDLIVMPRGSGQPLGELTSSVAKRVMAAAACPVLVVPASKPARIRSTTTRFGVGVRPARRRSTGRDIRGGR